MIDYIGDISVNDAKTLQRLAQASTRVLEFGCGASTQVLAAYAQRVISIETEQTWIDKTIANLARLELSNFEFMLYQNFSPNGEYDLIFDDGVDGLRLVFANNVWNFLRIGGKLCFHDTRRSQDIKNVCDFIALHSPEIESVVINVDHSNITVITKKLAEFYENWNLVEGKELWQYGKA